LYAIEKLHKDLRESSKKRLIVLEYSLTMELMASFALAFLLDIDFDKTKESKSLGNSSSALSFNQKVNLLLDNKSIDKDEKLKLESFMNIRNQFMHNKDADSYEKAVGYISGLENRLKKIYPRFFKNMKIEDSLEKCVAELFSESISILGDYKGGREKKMTVEIERDIYSKKYKVLEKVMKSHLDKAEDFIKNHKSDNIKKDELIPLLSLLKYQILFDAEKEYIDGK